MNITDVPSIGAWLSDCAASHGSSARIRIEGECTTAERLDGVASSGATGLRSLGLRTGDRVGVLMRASVTALETWFSIARAGLVEVPLNPDSGPGLLEYCLGHGRVRAVVCDRELLEVLRPIADRLDGLEHVIVPGSDDSTIGSAQVRDLGRLFEADPTDVPEMDPGSPAVILYTSGTTGPPKGVLLSHRANVNLARHTVGLMGYTAEDHLYSVFPLYHSNARFCSVMAALESGADLLMHRRFSASRFWTTCREHGITAFNYQGAMMSILHKQPPSPDDRAHQVRAAFGAPCPAEIFEDFERRFGVELTEIYGSTEVSIVCDMPPGERRIGTAGTESENYHVAVVDEHDEPQPPGVPGEIVARPKRPGWMFDGYDNRPGATVEAWRNLWFHTGDRGVMDADGFLTFLDRVKDTIRRRGENISSWEVERVVADDPSVAQVAAYGVPSELSEEEVMVAVVPASGASLDPAALMARCDEALTSFARPRYVRVLDSLPQTPSQRVEKYRLRDEGITPDTWDREVGR